MKVTIKELANHLGLSIATVSRALDGYPDISEKTRQRVLAAALTLGYAPDRAARQLRRGRTDTIGFILPAAAEFQQPFFNELMAGLADGASSHQLDVLISACADGEDVELHLYRSWVQGHRVDGLIVTRTWLNDRRIEYLTSMAFPFVCLEPPASHPEAPGVSVSSREALVCLIDYMAGRGFERQAFLGGPEELTIQHNRQQAFLAATSRAGLPLREEWMVTGILSSQGGYDTARRLLMMNPAPNTLVCINDEVALGALHAARDLGLQVGTQVAVAAFDGLQSAAHANPPLTTIDQPVSTLAHHLTDLLHRRLQGGVGMDEQIILQPIIHLRASTGDLAREISSPFIPEQKMEVQKR